MIIQVKVTNKHAQVLGTPVIVCGNNDYRIRFTFDIEWAPGAVKTARFVYIQDGTVAYTDAVFEGDTVAVPVLANTREVRVGVFEGDLQTTTPAVIPCELSIRCGTGAPVDPTPSQYDQIMELLSQGVGGVSRWSDIPDKPFTYLVEPDTLIWNGNTEGCTLWERPGTGWTYYKVSDSVPSREELANGGSMNWSTSGASTFDSSAVYEQYTKSARVGNYIFICHTDDAAEAGVEAGTYFRKYDNSGYATSFTVNGYIGYGKEQIDPAVLPDDIGGGVSSWDDLTDKPFGNVSIVREIMPEIEITGMPVGDCYVAEFDVSLFTGNEQVMKIVFDGTEYICHNKEGMFGNSAFFVGEDTGEPFLMLVWLDMGAVGMYLLDDKPHMISITEMEYTKIAKEFLPDVADNTPVRLYTDDVYLYTVGDTSDVSRRVTESQLQEYFDNGKNVWVCVDKVGAAQYMRAENYLLAYVGGAQYCVLYVYNCLTGKAEGYYTAGYTAS